MANESKPVKQTFFKEVAAAFSATPADKAHQDKILNEGVATARWRANQMYHDMTNKRAPSVVSIRERYQTEADLANELPGNPFYFVPADFVEHTYRSWALSGGKGTPPWELLAISVKEGWNIKPNRQIPTYRTEAASAQNAKDLFRAEFYWRHVGLDYFICHTPQARGDSKAAFTDADALCHRTHFKSSANQIIPGIAEKIDAALLVSPHPSGRGYNVEPTPRFYELSLQLTDAYFRVNVKNVPENHFGLGYMRWNMGVSRFRPFMESSERHRKEPENLGKTAAEWAFKTKIKSNEYPEPRMNALTFMYYSEVYRMAFEDIDWK